MSVFNYSELASHEGHEIECVIYGDDENAALECVDCGVVLLDFNADEDQE